ncbi:MAG: hypothetical protein E7C23_04415 [Klebsiella grimontii]|nr:hypothetical protein [Klebsiella grimontii]
MTTDITELAQREKFEAWWERTQHNGNPPRFGWSRWRDGEGYKVDDDDSELDGMWEAWKAAGAELVEALEKAQQENTDGVAGMAESYETTISMLRSRIAELESRTVKLPKRSVGEVMHMSGFSRDYAEGWCAGNDNAIHEIHNSGIKVEG